MNEKGQKSGLVCVFSSFFGWGPGVGRKGMHDEKNQIKAEQVFTSRHVLSPCYPHPHINLHGHVSPDP